MAKSSIGRKVIVMMAILCGVFLVTIAANVIALSSIRENNDRINIYLDMGQVKSQASAVFQKIQLYSNLSYYKQGTDEIDSMREKLEASISEMKGAMDTLGGYCEQLKDTDMIVAYETWDALMTDFLEYCARILEEAEKEDFEAAGMMVDELKEKKDPVQEAEDAYGILTSSQVTVAVENLAQNAEDMLRFIDENVMKDYDSFVDVVEKYEQDADHVNEILTAFADNSGDISHTIQGINVSINDIASAVDENARGVTSVAVNASGLAASIRQIQKETENNQDISLKLSSEVNRFKNV